MNETHVNESVDALLGRVATEFFERVGRGESPTMEEYTERYPEIADDIRRTFPAIGLIGESLSSTGIEGEVVDLADRQQLGDFRIVRELGRGGMGIVYEAEQLSLPRRVALKVLPFAAILHQRQLHRFQNEARAAATLDHPGIVSIYSVGCERGVHFYAMQLIEGQTLAQVIGELRQCEQRSGVRGKGSESGSESADGDATSVHFKTTLREAQQAAETPPVPQAVISTGRSTTKSPHFCRAVAELGVQAAEAVDHAHMHGVLHRDIKPANLMLDTDGKLWVTDFGLARIEADPGMTMTGDILGTLRYMSPEQALAKRAVVDQRADIYSLGVTLYEMLTLEPVFGASDRQELLKQIAFEEPKRPGRLNKAISSELETIILKAIAKNANDRYEMALELAGDLQCFLENKPIKARRVSKVERFWRWSRRNPVVSGLTAAVAILAILVAVVSTVAYVKTGVALAEVSQERDETFRSLYVAHMRLAQKDWNDGQIARLRTTLLKYLPETGKPDLRGWEWYYHLSRCFSDWKTLGGHRVSTASHPVRALAWSRDGTSLASAASGEIKVCNPETGDLIETIRRRAFPGGLFAWSSDDRRITLHDSDGQIEVHFGKTHVTLNGARVTGDPYETVAWSPDGVQLASSAPDKSVIIWDAETGVRLRELVGHNTEVRQVAWSPEGNHLAATGYEPGTITIWNVETGEQTRTLESGQFNYCIAWSPDSTRLAAGTFYGNAFVWDVTSGEKVLALSDKGSVWSVTWSPDGSQIATGIKGYTITLWDAKSGQLLRKLQGHTGIIERVAWSPDGKWIASGDRRGIVKIWDAKQDPVAFTLANDAEHGGVAFSPDDGRLAYWALGQTIKVCDVATGRELHALAGPVGDALEPVWSPDGKHLACGGDDGSIVVYDTQQGALVQNWMHEGVKQTVFAAPPSGRTVNVAWHPDGRQLASVSMKVSTVRIWDIKEGDEISSFEASGPSGNTESNYSVAWSPDGERLATGGREGPVVIWDRVGWRGLHTIRTTARDVGWSRNGRYLAVGTSIYNSDVKVVDTFTGRITQILLGHTGSVKISGWSEDGRRLATVSQDGIRMWDVKTGREMFSLSDAKAMAWSHDRKRLATVYDGTVRVYDASIGYEMASDPILRQWRAGVLMSQARSLARNGQCQEALAKLDAALRFAPKDAEIQMNAAWLLATFSDKRVRDAPRAFELARKVTESSPKSLYAWQVLGWAQYRKGNCKASVEALEKSIELQKNGGDPWQWFFLAMAHWQLGHQEEARRWFD